MKNVLKGLVLIILVVALLGLTFQELEELIGMEVYYIDPANLPNDLTEYVPPTGILTQTKVDRISDGAGSVITRTAVVDGHTLATNAIFDNVNDAYTGLALQYNQLRIEAVAAVQKYITLRDEALILAGE